VVGVVEPDRQELARPDGGQQANVGEGVALVSVSVGDVSVLDDPRLRTVAGIESTQPHHDTSGISTGACSGAYPPAIALAWMSANVSPLA
jgi:hypothetical protein